MSIETTTPASPHTGPRRSTIAIAAAVILVVGAIALDTKVVQIGSSEDVRKAGFSAETFGAAEFPKVKAAIEERAVDGVTLATAIAGDKAAATKQYGVASANTAGAVFPVSFTGVVGEGKSGVYAVKVDGLPDGLLVRVQTGPAINGTELRDATGTIQFGQFTNQIEFQNAGSALNNEMKKQVLAAVDTAALSGKTVKVVGAFRLVNPKSWLVTPVRIDVQ